MFRTLTSITCCALLGAAAVSAEEVSQVSATARLSAQQIAQAHYAAQLEWYSYYRGRHGERTGFATPLASWQWPAPLRAD